MGLQCSLATDGYHGLCGLWSPWRAFMASESLVPILQREITSRWLNNFARVRLSLDPSLPRAVELLPNLFGRVLRQLGKLKRPDLHCTLICSLVSLISVVWLLRLLDGGRRSPGHLLDSLCCPVIPPSKVGSKAHFCSYNRVQIWYTHYRVQGNRVAIAYYVDGKPPWVTLYLFQLFDRRPGYFMWPRYRTFCLNKEQFLSFMVSWVLWSMDRIE